MIKTPTNRTAIKAIKRVVVCFSLAFSTLGIAETNSPRPSQNDGEIGKRVDAYFTQIEKKDFSGAVLIGCKGDIILSKGYGFADKRRCLLN